MISTKKLIERWNIENSGWMQNPITKIFLANYFNNIEQFKCDEFKLFQGYLFHNDYILKNYSDQYYLLKRAKYTKNVGLISINMLRSIEHFLGFFIGYVRYNKHSWNPIFLYNGFGYNNQALTYDLAEAKIIIKEFHYIGFMQMPSDQLSEFIELPINCAEIISCTGITQYDADHNISEIYKAACR